MSGGAQAEVLKGARKNTGCLDSGNGRKLSGCNRERNGGEARQSLPLSLVLSPGTADFRWEWAWHGSSHTEEPGDSGSQKYAWEQTAPITFWPLSISGSLMCCCTRFPSLALTSTSVCSRAGGDSTGSTVSLAATSQTSDSYSDSGDLLILHDGSAWVCH